MYMSSAELSELFDIRFVVFQLLIHSVIFWHPEAFVLLTILVGRLTESKIELDEFLEAMEL